MEFKINLTLEQIIDIVRQLPETERERLKREFFSTQESESEMLHTELAEYRDVFLMLDTR